MKTRTRSTELDRVDINAIKFGQGTTAGLLALAFVTDLWLLAALIGGVNLIALCQPGSISCRACIASPRRCWGFEPASSPMRPRHTGSPRASAGP